VRTSQLSDGDVQRIHPKAYIMVEMIKLRCLFWGIPILMRVLRNSERIIRFRFSGNGDIGPDNDVGGCSRTTVRILVLPHGVRGEVSIIAVQVKVGVECVVKSSEFKFCESRVNETRFFPGGGRLSRCRAFYVY
jgi:hypothetical protein